MPRAEIPERPRMCRGLAVAAVSDGIIVEGAPRRSLFRGAAATTVLPRMLRLLDGGHSRAELCRLLDLSGAQLDQVVSLLDDSGLLDRVADDEIMARLPGATRAYLSRSISATGYRGSDEVARVLVGSSVHVIGDLAFGAAVAADLAESGVGTTSFASEPPARDSEVVAAAGRAGSALVIVDDGTTLTPRDPLAETIAAFGTAGVPVLRTARTRGHLEIGPKLLAGSGACVDCLRDALRDAPWHAEPDERVGPYGDDDTYAGLVVGETLAQLARITQPAQSRTVTRYGLANWSATRYVLVPKTDCRTCGGATPAYDAGAEVADRYEWTVAHLAEPLMAEPNESRGYLKYLTRLQRERDRLPTQPRAALPNPVHFRRTTGSFGAGTPRLPDDAPPVDAVTLAGLVTMTAGRRRPEVGDDMSRWAPNGGNMASVQAYVVSEHDPFGLPGTIFGYDDLSHQMRATSPDHVAMADVLAGTDLAEAAPDIEALVVLTADVRRLARKYHWFALRLAHLDAGCAATQLAAVAGGYGLQLRFASRWDQRLTDWFDHTAMTELITVVAAVLRPASRRAGEDALAGAEGDPCH